MKVLKLDIDWKAPAEWREKWRVTRLGMLFGLGYDIAKVLEYETNRGYHYYIHISKDVDDATANYLQFLLGDDATRVKINQWRIERGIKHWNKLFSRVLWKRKIKGIRCYYCGNFIPIRERRQRNGLK